MKRVERYRGVKGAENVRAISEALEASGAVIIKKADPSVAPFELVVKTPAGELLDLVCYAFTANEYRQGGRPAGEHRFQVKYGSDFQRAHNLYLDESRRRITLMFGVHHELGLFVAVDPRMHNPTWFSMSIEMKAAELHQAASSGWHTWERERNDARRRIARPNENLQTESVLAFKPEHFLRYAAFERLASGLDTGERMLMADRMAAATAQRSAAGTISHPLETTLGLNALEILDVLSESFRLLVAVRGSVAEHHLLTQLRSARGIEQVERLDLDGQPDFKVRYRKRDYRIECKNVLRKMHLDKVPRVDFQKTRASKDSPCSRYYEPSQFEVLAACLHPVTERWEYRFCTTEALPRHERCEGRLSSKVPVDGEHWTDDVTQALDSLR